MAVGSHLFDEVQWGSKRAVTCQVVNKISVIPFIVGNIKQRGYLVEKTSLKIKSYYKRKTLVPNKMNLLIRSLIRIGVGLIRTVQVPY